MQSVFEDAPVQEKSELDELSLFVVWIDSNCGHWPQPDWDQNSAPQALQTALVEAKEVREKGWPAVIMLEGVSPRPDGSFD